MSSVGVNIPVLAILGPTASGKTRSAVLVAHALGAEVVSADSRQLYRGMDIGTGKDLDEYASVDPPVSFHLIDLWPAGERGTLFDYLSAYYAVMRGLVDRGSQGILCGGSGLYAEAVLRNYSVVPVGCDGALRERLRGMSQAERVRLLASLAPLHNETDTQDPERTVRAIEIALAEHGGINPHNGLPYNTPIGTRIFALTLPVAQRRERISARLKERLERGLVEEVSALLESGIAQETLYYYGLEYRYVSQFLMGEVDYGSMVRRLETEIHRFAKRQMTYLRGMERRGCTLEWVDCQQGPERAAEEILGRMSG